MAISPWLFSSSGAVGRPILLRLDLAPAPNAGWINLELCDDGLIRVPV
jgi:hypothetical protein